MIEINLVPDVKQELLQAQRMRTVVVTFSIFAAIIAAGLVVLLALYIYGVQTVRHVVADNQINEGITELQSHEDLPGVLTIQNQLDQIDILSQSRQVNSRIFNVLSAVIPPAPNNVQVLNMTNDVDLKVLTIEGQTPTYDSLETFKKTLDGAVATYTVNGEEVQDPLATDISLSDIAYGEDADGDSIVRFTISFIYPELLFSAQVPSVVIKLTNAGNVTDSYLGIPKTIFVEQPTQQEEN